MPPCIMCEQPCEQGQKKVFVGIPRISSAIVVTVTDVVREASPFWRKHEQLAVCFRRYTGLLDKDC